MRLTLSSLVLATILAAGYVGPVEGPADAGTDAAADASAADAFGAQAAPCSGSGRSEGLACAPGTVCRVVEPSSAVPLPQDAPILRVFANVTWTPRDPTLEAIGIYLLRTEADGSWSWKYSPDSYLSGSASPIQVEAHLDDVEPVQYHLHVRAVHQAPSAAGDVHAGLSQACDVEGVALVRAA